MNESNETPIKIYIKGIFGPQTPCVKVCKRWFSELCF